MSIVLSIIQAEHLVADDPTFSSKPVVPVYHWDSISGSHRDLDSRCKILNAVRDVILTQQLYDNNYIKLQNAYNYFSLLSSNMYTGFDFTSQGQSGLSCFWIAGCRAIELMIGIMPRHSLEWEQKNGPELIGELGFLFSENVDKKRPKSSALYVLDMPHSLKLAQKKYEFPVQPEWKQCDDQSRLMNGLYLLTSPECSDDEITRLLDSPMADPSVTTAAPSAVQLTEQPLAPEPADSGMVNGVNIVFDNNEVANVRGEIKIYHRSTVTIASKDISKGNVLATGQDLIGAFECTAKKGSGNKSRLVIRFKDGDIWTLADIPIGGIGKHGRLPLQLHLGDYDKVAWEWTKQEEDNAWEIFLEQYESGRWSTERTTISNQSDGQLGARRSKRKETESVLQSPIPKKGKQEKEEEKIAKAKEKMAQEKRKRKKKEKEKKDRKERGNGKQRNST